LEAIPTPPIDLISLAPVLVLAVFGMMVLITDLFIGKDKSILVFMSLTGLLMAAISSLAKFNLPVHSFNGAYVVDHLSVFFTFIFCISSAMAILLSVDFNKREEIKVGEYYSLILFCTLGMVVLASSTDMIMIFLGIEIISISLYILAGVRRKDIKSNEAALKYFLLGAFATGFLLYGMALIYGSTGSTKLAIISKVISGSQIISEPLMIMGVVLLIIGFSFKVAAVPFHMWAPDVYQGAPTPVTAFMAVGPKAASLAAFYRIMTEAMPGLSYSWEILLCIVSVLSMFIGNLGAIMQTNIKRLIAFSSVSHVGYLLIAIIAKNSLSSSSLMFYMLTYAFMIFGVFGIVVLLGRKGDENLEIENYSGLAYKHPIIALTMTIFLLSLGGLPPLAGFVAKFYIFSAALNEGYLILVIIAVLNSAISFYYYLKVIVFMYMKEPVKPLNVTLSPMTLLVIAISVFGTIQLGIYPDPIISLAQAQ